MLRNCWAEPADLNRCILRSRRRTTCASFQRDYYSATLAHVGRLVADAGGLATRHAVPAIYERREYAAAGGLISYGPSLAVLLELDREAGLYAGKISRP
jgi:hypothetical protein